MAMILLGKKIYRLVGALREGKAAPPELAVERYPMVMKNFSFMKHANPFVRITLERHEFTTGV